MTASARGERATPALAVEGAAAAATPEQGGAFGLAAPARFPRPRGKEIACALFGFGLLMPLLAGGNVLFLLEWTDAIAYFMLVALGLTWLVVHEARSAPEPPDRLRAAAAGSLVAFLVWWCGNLVFRASAGRAPTEAQGFLGAALVYALFCSYPPDRDAVRKLVGGLVAGCLITAVYGQYQYWVMFPEITPLLRAMGRDPFILVNANFYNANSYAAFLGAVVLLTAALFSGGSRGERLLALVSWPVLALTLVLSGSRSTWLLTLAGAAALVAAGARDRVRRHAALLRALCVAVAALAAAAFVVDFRELWRVGTLGRLAIFHGAARMIADHWIFGVGPGRFAEYFDHYRTTDYYTRYPHDFLLEVFAESGIVGVATLMAFLVSALAVAVRAARATAEEPRLRTILLAAVALLVAHASVDIDWHAPADVVLLFGLLGLAGGPLEGREPA